MVFEEIEGRDVSKGKQRGWRLQVHSHEDGEVRHGAIKTMVSVISCVVTVFVHTVKLYQIHKCLIFIKYRILHRLLQALPKM